jgi:hypothetical protein
VPTRQSCCARTARLVWILSRWMLAMRSRRRVRVSGARMSNGVGVAHSADVLRHSLRRHQNRNTADADHLQLRRSPFGTHYRAPTTIQGSTSTQSPSLGTATGMVEDVEAGSSGVRRPIARRHDWLGGCGDHRRTGVDHLSDLPATAAGSVSAGTNN